ncbi:MAG: FtsQ-type POTRA domain-containing protein [Syntrophomonas sp.]
MKKSGKAKIFSFFLLILVSLVSFYLFLHSAFFKVDKITITGLEKVSRDEVIRLSGLKTGVNIFEIDEQFIPRALLIHPMIKSAVIVRHIPREIEVRVVERKIWALVPYEDSLLCVDDEGVCIDKISTFSLQNYPFITMDTMPARVNLGQAVNAEAIGMIKKLWDALTPESRKEISDFHFINKSKEIVLYTSGGTEVRFGGLERLSEKVGFFNQVFKIEEDTKNDGTQVLEYIDLRFKGQPVVKTRV